MSKHMALKRIAIPALDGAVLMSIERGRAIAARHAHESMLIGLVRAGARELTVRRTRVNVPTGGMFLLNPDEPHSSTTMPGDGESYSALCLPPEALYRILDDAGSAPAGQTRFARPLALDADIRSAFVRLVEKLEESASFYVLSQYFQALFVMLANHGICVDPPRQPDAGAGGLERARRIILTECDRDVTLDELAQAARVSPSALVRGFARRFGLTPHAYLVRARLKRARMLLDQGVPQSEAAATTGFFDQSHFANAFRKYYGLSPGRYRAALGLHEKSSEKTAEHKQGVERSEHPRLRALVHGQVLPHGHAAHQDRQQEPVVYLAVRGREEDQAGGG
ncbi:AraC family transcriptional regulator [Desulfocurvibacter africanus]|uniref:AraC family transcriptional regulator n=1 Tax=Desulfocurvibacter africanus TaxID=873 RepID=UPI0003F7F5AA|nr:AraC family transcriptional regulator [Desulfocurvibacter africanus]